MADDAPLTCDVLVVGAGPTGLMLANWLARLGVRVVVVDKKDGPTVQSRAIAVQARTMEIYDQLGLVDTVLAQSRIALALEPGYERTRFGVVRFAAIGAGVSPYPWIYVLEQSRTETILRDSLLEAGVEVLWNTGLEFADVEADGSVSAVVTGGLVIRATYCVGTDGSGSVLRRLLGIDFEGMTNEHSFYVCDATDVRGLSEEQVNLRFGDRDFLLTFPLEGRGHQRLIGLLPEGAVDASAESERLVREMLDRVYGVQWGGSAWFSIYRVHHRVASAFRQGPFFLAGDAAHVHSPVGAQGMNTGLQDAHNLALKMADVLQGRATDAWLDRYEAERRPVAQRLVSTTDRAFGFATSTRAAARFLRRWVAPIVFPVVTRVLPLLPIGSRPFEYLSQVRIHYWMSDGSKEHANGRRDPVVGRRLPYTGDNFGVLRSVRWQVHAYGGVSADVAERLGDRLGLPVHVFAADPRARLAPGQFYLVRPDGFVAAQSAPGDAAEVLRAALPVGFAR